MIITRDKTPRVLSYKSRDYQLLATLWDLVANSIKLDATYLSNLVNPEKCKSNWLKYLASLVGYSYDDTLTAEQNRFIIANYRALVRLRGSSNGVELAVAIYLKLIGRNDTSFRVQVPKSNSDNLLESTIYIDDENMDITKIPLLVKLLDIVRPVGVSYVMRRSTAKTFQNEGQIINTLRANKHKEANPYDEAIAQYKSRFQVQKSDTAGDTESRSSFKSVTGTNGAQIEVDTTEVSTLDDNTVGHGVVASSNKDGESK